jgi:hypothetical protein
LVLSKYKKRQIPNWKKGKYEPEAKQEEKMTIPEEYFG